MLSADGVANELDFLEQLRAELLGAFVEWWSTVDDDTMVLRRKGGHRPRSACRGHHSAAIFIQLRGLARLAKVAAPALGARYDSLDGYGRHARQDAIASWMPKHSTAVAPRHPHPPAALIHGSTRARRRKPLVTAPTKPVSTWNTGGTGTPTTTASSASSRHGQRL